MNAGARRSLSSVLLGTACLVVTSCGRQETCVNVKVGDRLVITLGEQFDRNPYTAGWEPETCQEAFGIYAGMELAVTIDGFRMGNTCESAKGLIEGLDEVSLSREGALIVHEDAIFLESYSYTSDTCSGVMEVGVKGYSLPISAWSGTGRPPGTVYFNFIQRPASDDCPKTCGVQFTAQVRVE